MAWSNEDNDKAHPNHCDKAKQSIGVGQSRIDISGCSTSNSLSLSLTLILISFKWNSNVQKEGKNFIELNPSWEADSLSADLDTRISSLLQKMNVIYLIAVSLRTLSVNKGGTR
jgi:hypothetical protein